jgi:hypothetical protein
MKIATTADGIGPAVVAHVATGTRATRLSMLCLPFAVESGEIFVR